MSIPRILHSFLHIRFIAGFLREEPVLFECLFKNIGLYDLTNNLLKQSCSCTLSFQQKNYNNENIENQIRVLAAWNNYKG